MFDQYLQTDKATARLPEEKEIAHQNRKVKEAQAKMELHEAKARHAAEKLAAKQTSHLYGHVHHPRPVASSGADYYGTHQPVVGTHAEQQQPAIDPVTGATIPGYPLGGHPTGHKYM